MKILALPAVTRVRAGRELLVEPGLDPGWSEAEKLAWRAALVAYDTGLRITVHDEAWTDGCPQPGFYSITVYGTTISSASAFTYRDAWTYLNGVAVGARAKETSDVR